MTKAVKELLATAKALAEKVNNEELNDSIEALEYLGDEAKASTQEYKDLQSLVKELQEEQGEKGKELQEEQGEKGKELQEEQKPKRLNYAGVYLKGSKWYHKSDKHLSNGFDTADECAKFFNKA